MPVRSRSKLTFLTRQIAVRKVVDRLVGFESENPPLGFSWDRRSVLLAENLETLPFPGIKKSHLNAIPRGYWQNGPTEGSKGDDLKVVSIKKESRSDVEKWSPVLNCGSFSLWRDNDTLYSDNSVVEYLSPSALDINNRSYHTLSYERDAGIPIRATIYKRSSENENTVWREYRQNFLFTGTLDSDGEEHLTRDNDTIYWNYVDTTKREFITFVRDGKIFLQFNQNAVEEITSTTAPSTIDDFNDHLHVGVSDGSANQIFETQYFPLASDGLKVYVVDSSASTWTEYSVVTSFTSTNQVKVDTETGRVIFGTAALGGSPSVNNDIYITCKAVPRIEYEELGYDTKRTAFDANVNPFGQSINKGFVVLTRSDLDIASIKLETNKALYSYFSDTFGPIYAGADHAKLIATVYSSSGKPVPGIEVTFSMQHEPSVGSIGNSGLSAQYRSGHDGKARTFYTTPNSALSMGFYVTSVSDTNKLQLRPDANFTTPSDIYTYYVLKDDPWIGKIGADTSLGEVEWDPIELNGRKAILYTWDATAINPITGIVGAYAPLIPTSVSTDGTLLTYGQTLEEPDISSTPIGGGGKNLGAYWVVSDRVIPIVASAYSTRYKRTIFSNTIYLRVEIPEYMKGVYVNDALQRIPFGHRVTDGDYEYASAIGGATFVSINPIAGPHNIIDIIAGETQVWPTVDLSYPYSYPSYDANRPHAYLTFEFTVSI